MQGRNKNVQAIDTQLLEQLWSEDEMTMAEIAKEIGVSASWLSKHQDFLGLPRRKPRRQSLVADPTPDEIAERAAECRQRHFEYRRKYGHPEPQPGRLLSQSTISDPTFFSSYCDGVL